MAAGGQDLPRDILLHIFPIAYWDLIRKYSAQNNLDPYLIAALMAQESTFVPGIRSHATCASCALSPRPAAGTADEGPVFNAPAPASRRCGWERSKLADLSREFGGVHLALASYNAGDTAVRRWMTERPGLTDREEFIDDIRIPRRRTT